MKTELEKQQLKIFLAGLGIAALVINIVFLSSVKRPVPVQPYVPQQTYVTPAPAVAPVTAAVPVAPTREEQLQKQQEEAARKAAEEHVAYLNRYLNPGFARKAGLKNIAIAAMSGNAEANRPVADALATRLSHENLALFTSFFKPAFFADGLFSQIFGGSLDCVDKLELTKNLDALLLAQEQIEYSTNGAALDNVISARARLDVAFLPFATMRPEQTWAFTASGAGFSPGEARKNAEDRLFKQIAKAEMSLVPLSPDKQESY